MNKFKKLMCLFLSVLMILSMGIPAFAIDKATDSTSTNETQKTAVNAEKNPLEITIATDKAEYKVTNVAEITATVTNTGKEDIKNVSAEAIFNDLAPVGKKTSETKKEVETLKAGESISFTYKATLNAKAHKLNIFQKIFLWFVRLFNGGYTPSDNGFDNGRDCTEQTYNLIFGKFATENVIRVWYGENGSDNSDIEFVDFYADTHDVIVGENEEVTFYAKIKSDITIDDNKIVLFSEDESIGILLDNGKGADKIANDGIFTGTFSLYSPTSKEKYYCAKYLSKESLKTSINFHTEITKESLQSNSKIMNDIKDILKEENNKDKRMEFIIDYLDNAINSGMVSSYTDVTSGIMIRFPDGGLEILYYETILNYKEQRNISSNFSNRKNITYKEETNTIATNNEVIVLEPFFTSFGYDYLDCVANISETVDNYSNPDNYRDNSVTLELMKTLDKYKVIIISSHGGFAGINNDDFGFLLGINATNDDEWFDYIISHREDYRSGNIYRGVLEDGSCWLGVRTNFFWNNFETNSFNNALVFMGTCHGADNNALETVLKSRGVSTLYAFSGGVPYKYCDDMYTSVFTLLQQDYNTGIYETAYNALMMAQDIHGKTSISKYPELVGSFINLIDGRSELHIFGNKNWSFPQKTYGSVTGTVKEQYTNNPLQNIKVIATNKNKTISTHTDKNGEFSIKLPVGEWEISVEDTDTHYCHETLTVTIEENVETVLINHIYMTRKTGEALCAVYDKTTNNAIENVKIEAVDISSKPLISSYDEFKKHEIIATATTDSKGLASLDLTYGSYLLAFTHDNYEYFMKEVEINAELDISAYDVKLTPKGSSGEDDRPVTASGDCGKNGDNVKWVLYDDGELVISGQGRMADYSGNDNPWNKHKESITSITIEDGVTYIGNASFYNSINLESISFPASLLQIGADAFNSCISLKQLVLPNRLTSIGAYAFYKCEELVEAYLPSALVSLGGNAFGYCKKMKDIVIPEGLCSIGEGAFWHCESITKFSIPSSVELIGQGAFGGCYTCSAFAVSKSNKKYSCYESVLFDKEKKVLINYPIGNTSETYIIPDTVEIVQSYAFGGHPTNGHLSSIEFGANLKCFESNVFEWGGSAQNKIHDVYYKGTLSQWCEIDFESRESNPCYNGSNGSFLHIQDEELTELKIPSSITNIKPFTFCGINNIQKIKFHNNVTNIGDGAFESCHSLKEVKIPDSTVYIASEAFSECPALEYVSLPKNITVDNLAFSGGYDNSELTIVLDGGICTFKGQAFWNHSIAHVHYNGTMQDWCSSHFSSYYSSPAWFGSDFTVDGQTIKANYSNDISIIIPDGVEKINDYAFSGRYINPENFYIPKSIKYIGEHIFDNRVGAVIYQGSEEEWNAVTIEPDNANLNKAAIQFLNN